MNERRMMEIKAAAEKVQKAKARVESAERLRGSARQLLRELADVTMNEEIELRRAERELVEVAGAPEPERVVDGEPPDVPIEKCASVR